MISLALATALPPAATASATAPIPIAVRRFIRFTSLLLFAVAPRSPAFPLGGLASVLPALTGVRLGKAGRHLGRPARVPAPPPPLRDAEHALAATQIGVRARPAVAHVVAAG